MFTVGVCKHYILHSFTQKTKNVGEQLHLYSSCAFKPVFFSVQPYLCKTNSSLQLYQIRAKDYLDNLIKFKAPREKGGLIAWQHIFYFV